MRRAFTKSLLLDPRTLRALQQSVSDWRHERAAATNLAARWLAGGRALAAIARVLAFSTLDEMRPSRLMPVGLRLLAFLTVLMTAEALWIANNLSQPLGPALPYAATLVDARFAIVGPVLPSLGIWLISRAFLDLLPLALLLTLCSLRARRRIPAEVHCSEPNAHGRRHDAPFPLLGLTGIMLLATGAVAFWLEPLAARSYQEIASATFRWSVRSFGPDTRTPPELVGALIAPGQLWPHALLATISQRAAWILLAPSILLFSIGIRRLGLTACWSCAGLVAGVYVWAVVLDAPSTPSLSVMSVLGPLVLPAAIAFLAILLMIHEAEDRSAHSAFSA